MSLVRYTNKKTGWVSIYESTSHYDPASKKSRPIRKYLGYEDPATGAFVASSGKPGRKKKSAGKEGAAGNPKPALNDRRSRSSGRRTAPSGKR